MNSLRLVRPEELDTVWALVERAIARMHQRGNDQWGEDYPFPALYAEDISRDELWCVTNEDNVILGVAAFVCKHEEDYENVPFRKPEPAVSLHRIAVDPVHEGRGVAHALFARFEEIGLERGVAALRIDTYHLNHTMQHLIRKHGFDHIGDIYFPDRTLPNHCYEKILKEDDV